MLMNANTEDILINYVVAIIEKQVMVEVRLDNLSKTVIKTEAGLWDEIKAFIEALLHP